MYKNTFINAIVKTQFRYGSAGGLGWAGAVLVWRVHVGFHFPGFHRDEHRGDSQHHGELLHHSHSGAPEPAHLHPVLQPQGAEDRQLSKPSSQFVLCILITGRGDRARSVLLAWDLWTCVTCALGCLFLMLKTFLSSAALMGQNLYVVEHSLVLVGAALRWQCLNPAGLKALSPQGSLHHTLCRGKKFLISAQPLLVTF